jgi:hypothetical protein
MAEAQGAGDKKEDVLGEIAELHVIEGGAVWPGDANQEGGQGDERDKSGHDGRRWKGAGFDRTGCADSAPGGVAGGEKQQGHTEPKRACSGKESSMGDIASICGEKTLVGVPYACGVIAGQGLYDEHKQQGGQAETEGAIPQKAGGTLFVNGPGDKIAGYEKQQSHKKRLEEYLVGHECQLLWKTQVGGLHDVPAAVTAVGNGGVHAHHQHDHDPSEVVDKQQPCRSQGGCLSGGGDDRFMTGGGGGSGDRMFHGYLVCPIKLHVAYARGNFL